jgi:hypothetical protein
MKKILFIFICIFFHYQSNGQHYIIIPIPIPDLHDNIFKAEDFPISNSEISFTLPYPFVAYKDSILDRKSTHNFITKVAAIPDSILSQCIKYSMLSFNFEPDYCNIKSGAEIWSGITKGDRLTHAGIYYKHDLDSTKIYVLTTFPPDRKSKVNYSELICNRIKLILETHLKQKKD